MWPRKDSSFDQRDYGRRTSRSCGPRVPLTGNAADADDIVQETFMRALTRPPADQERDWRPWLIRVAVNLGRDLLRYRRRRGHDGVWLPSPVEIEPPSYEPVALTGDPASPDMTSSKASRSHFARS